MSTFKKYLQIVNEVSSAERRKALKDFKKSEITKNIDSALKEIKTDNPELKTIIDNKIIDYEKFMKNDLMSTLDEFKKDTQSLTEKANIYLKKSIEISIKNIISDHFNSDMDAKIKKESSTSDTFKDFCKTIIRSIASDFNSKKISIDSFTTSYRISMPYIKKIISETIVDISNNQLNKFYSKKDLNNFNTNGLWKYISKYFENNSNINSYLEELIKNRFVNTINKDLIKSIGSDYLVDFLLDVDQSEKRPIDLINFKIESEKKFGEVIEFRIFIDNSQINLNNAEGRKIPKVSIGGHNRIEWLKKPQKEREEIENRNRDRKISREDSLRASVGSAKGQLAKENSGYYGDNRDYHRWKKEVGRRQKELNKYLKNK